jgi:hypothetical protein
MDTDYSIPFTPENIDKHVKKYVTAQTQFIIRDKGGNDRKVSVDSLDELRLGTPEHLLRFGHRASDYEKLILAEERQGNYSHHKPPNEGSQYR